MMHNDNDANEAKKFNLEGIAEFNRDQYQIALNYFDQALHIARALNDKAEEATSLRLIGWVYDAQKNYAKALEFYEKSLSIRRDLGNRDGEARTLTDIGVVYASQEKYEQALKFHQESLTIARLVGNRSAEANALNNIGQVYAQQERYEQALRSYKEALAIVREVNERTGEKSILKNIENLPDRWRPFQLFDLTTLVGIGTPIIGMGLVLTDFPLQVWVSWVLALLWLFLTLHAYIHPASPRYKDRYALFIASLIFVELAWSGYALLQGLTLPVLVMLMPLTYTFLNLISLPSYKHLISDGEKLLTQDRFEEAIERFEEVLIRGNGNENIEKIALLYSQLGVAYARLGFVSKAESNLEKSLSCSSTWKDWTSKAYALRNLAYIYTETGDGKKAIDLLKEAQLIYEHHGDKKGSMDENLNQAEVYRQLCDHPQAVDCKSREEALKHAQALNFEAYDFYKGWLENHEKVWRRLPIRLLRHEIQEYQERATNQLGGIANVYRLLGEWTTAKLYYKQQVAMGRGLVFLEDLSGLALCYLELGENFEAFKVIEQALEVNARDREQQNPSTEYLLYFRRGYLYERTNQMDNACRDYYTAIDRLDALRQNVKRAEVGVIWQRIGLLTQSEREAAARRLILLLAKRANKDKDTAWQAAFTVLERSRSRSLQEELMKFFNKPQRLNFYEVQTCLKNV